MHSRIIEKKEENAMIRMFRTLEDIMSNDLVMGFQSESEIAIAKRLVEKMKYPESENNLFAEAMKRMQDYDQTIWNNHAVGGEIYVMLSDMTICPDRMQLIEVVPKSFHTSHGSYPLIYFKVKDMIS